MIFMHAQQMYEKDGQTLPGKKGISLSVEQYQALREGVLSGVIDDEIASLEKS